MDATAAVLDAAAECYLRIGVTKTTAADIARSAGISRATLYRRYGSHESIFRAVLERESIDMAAEAAPVLARITDPAERLVESMLLSMRQIGSRPLHAAIFTGDSAAWAAGQAIQMEALRRIGETAIRPLVSQGSTGSANSASGADSASDADSATAPLSDADVADLVDWIIRILLSFASVPGPAGRKPADIRRELTTCFLPAFERFLRT